MGTIAELKPDPKNARKHSRRNIDMLADSLRQVGAARSIVIDEEDVILAGHGVIEAARLAGIDRMRVIEADGNEIIAVRRSGLTERQKRKLSLYDNRVAELADWAPEKLADLIHEDEHLLAGMFSADELSDLLKDLEENQGEPPDAQIDKAEELCETWGAARGQVWEIPSRTARGCHRVMCGDSTVAEDVERLMKGSMAAVAVTSPPYGVGKSYETKGIGPWFDTVRPAIRLLCKSAKIVVWNIGDLYCTGSQFIEPTMAYSISMFMEQGYRPLWIRIWLKPGANFGVGPYHLASNKPVQQYEYAAAFGQAVDALVILQEDVPDVSDFEWMMAFAGGKHRFVRRLGKRERKDWGYAGVWRMNTVPANKEHPAMFPIELPTRAIKMHSGKMEIALDPFLGSGTTITAAEVTGRIGYGMEIQPKYVAVSLQRLADMGLKPSLLES